MFTRSTATVTALFLLASLTIPGAAPVPGPAAPELSDAELDKRFTDVVKPFLASYCTGCHGGEKPDAQFDLTKFTDVAAVTRDQGHWVLMLDRLTRKEMPPKEATEFPTDEQRQAVIDWLRAVRTTEIKKNAGDPGLVLARRLSNAEYNYTIRDLTGADIRPTREFPVDPANQAGFDNTGESLAMSPALMNKYIQAAREVASHMVLRLDGIDFASHPMLVETDRDKFCIMNIIGFYRAQNTDYADYFQTAWRYKHRAALGKPDAKLAELAAAHKVSPKYLDTVWRFLEETPLDVGPGAKLQKMWRELPSPKPEQPEIARAGCEQMRKWVVELRAKLEPRFMNLSSGRIRANSQPMLMWKNRQYANARMSYDRQALQIDGKIGETMPESDDEVGAANEFGPGRTQAVKNEPGDPDLFVPRDQFEKYADSFGKFCAVFPDAFYVEERGRNYLDKTKDKGRYLSAGFHNVMGYFRDDIPLYKLVLDETQQKQLDDLWHELDYIASGNVRTHIQFYFNESGEARGTNRESEGPRPKDLDVISERMVKQLEANYLRSAGATTQPTTNASGRVNENAIEAVREHFRIVNDGLRWVETARVETQPKHLESLLEFAGRAFRRPLSAAEKQQILDFYKSAREESKLEHEDAMRDCVVLVLMSPDFLYRIDLVGADAGVKALSDYALASRLSYFLWSSMPDAELMAAAKAGQLRNPDVLTAQAKRMLKDPRSRALAVEFGGNWLDFRRFEELNTVDRERFTSFDNDLRQAMFEEPVRYLLDVIQNNRSVLDLVYGKDTFVNPVLAKHYGMPEPKSGGWAHVADASEFGRGGLLPMAAFLTKNAPGLRTSPVKRGYWVVKQVLGEHIPPPPAAVPELPRDEAKMELALRDALAKHRQDPSCAACHERFDSLGLVFEGFGPVGERRTKDLAGRDIDPRATFPDGTEGAALEGLRTYIRTKRQDDFMNSLSQKLLAYGLGRTLMLSDEPTVDQMRERLAKDGYRFEALVESIVTSPQFLNKRGQDKVAQAH